MTDGISKAFRGTVYVACPYLRVTGGPTLAHQFAYELNQMGVSAKMYYYDKKGSILPEKLPEDSPYQKYGVDVAASLEEIDHLENYVVFPETVIILRLFFSKAKICVWWMSVDNYYGSLMGDSKRLEADYMYFKTGDLWHFVQSAYAYDFLKNRMHVDMKRAMYLTDYIDEVYQSDSSGDDSREDIVYYNYDKMGDELPGIMKNHPDINWVPIRNMTKEEIVDAFHRGKVYIDLGNHPGRDRLPREAAACGLCVITNRRGSAGFDDDVPIPSVYKFGSPADEEEELVNCIHSIFDDYESARMDFEYYREWIENDHNRFVNEVVAVVKMMSLESGC